MPCPFPPEVGDDSPWGRIDTRTPLGPDAFAVATASHGGIAVSPAALASLPGPLRSTEYSRDGWFEEDCDWCLPHLALSLDAFEPKAERAGALVKAARRTLEQYHPTLVAMIDALAMEPGR